MSIILSPKLSKCCLCCILSYMHYHSFSLPALSSLSTPSLYFSIHIYIHIYIYDPLFLNTWACIFKDKDVVLHNHSALIKIKKLTLIHHYHLIWDHFRFHHFPWMSFITKNKTFCPRTQPRIRLALCHLVSLLSHLEHF